MLVLGVNPNEEVVIGKDIVIHLARSDGSRPRLCIRAPKEVKIDRRERTDPAYLLAHKNPEVSTK